MGRAQRDDRQTAPGCAAPRTESWEGLCAPARLYLAAGAWKSAHDLLEGPLREIPSAMALPLDAVEPLCLFLAACTRLGHDEHFAAGCTRLREVESRAGQLPPEAAALLAHSLAQEETRAGRYAQALARLEALGEARLAEVGACTSARLALLEGRIAAALADERRAERAGLRAAERASEAGSESLRGDAYSLLAIVARRRGALAEA
ncbi:MAG: hypothetical protein FJY75_13805, partial [Candidatus Eisenbacteria bacterium]|nr:hypothetical protein [Candidatus Eisenbacteria bacterium]